MSPPHLDDSPRPRTEVPAGEVEERRGGDVPGGDLAPSDAFWAEDEDEDRDSGEGAVLPEAAADSDDLRELRDVFGALEGDDSGADDSDADGGGSAAQAQAMPPGAVGAGSILVIGPDGIPIAIDELTADDLPDDADLLADIAEWDGVPLGPRMIPVVAEPAGEAPTREPATRSPPTPTTAAAWVEVGRRLLDRRDAEKAMIAFQRALVLDPDDADAQTWVQLAEGMVVRDLCPGAAPSRVPLLLVAQEEIMDGAIDPELGLILAYIDGMTACEDLEALLPTMNRLALYRRLGDALARGLISLD